MKAVTGGLRFFQLVFCAVVLGLSINLAKGQLKKGLKGVSGVPATTSYSAFAGAFGLIAGAVGVVAIFLESLNGIITWALDAVAALVLVAGGVAMAIGLRGVNCAVDMDHNNPAAGNGLLNCGYFVIDDDGRYRYGCKDASVMESRCKMARADDVFMFLAFAVGLGALVTSFLWSRGGSKRSNYV